MSTRRYVAAASTFLAVLALSGCGLPTDDTYQPIDPGDLPFGLADTTTTSTTTTTIAPATTTTLLPTTTTAPTTEPVNVYFVAGNLLRPVVRQAKKPVTPLQALSLLQAEPPGAGLRTSIPAGALVAVTVAGGKATVDLAPAALEQQQGQEQWFEFGQIVLTLTDLRGIGQVEFRVPGPDGLPTLIQVPKGTGEFAPVVSRDDYLNLLAPA